jgi:hypothetical protein
MATFVVCSCRRAAVQPVPASASGSGSASGSAGGGRAAGGSAEGAWGRTARPLREDDGASEGGAITCCHSVLSRYLRTPCQLCIV